MPLRYGPVENIVLYVQKGSASDEEWSGSMDFIRGHLPKMKAPYALVISDSAPTPSQRSIMEKVLQPYVKSIRVAVVTSSTFTRGVVKALRLFVPTYEAFDPKEIRAAFDYLDV